MTEKKGLKLIGPQKGRIVLASLTIIALILFILPQHASAFSGIKLDVKPGVSSTHIKNLTLAINDIVKFFGDNYKLTLQKKMRIIVVPDDNVFETVLMADFNKNKKDAQRLTKNSAALATEQKGEYLLALKAPQSASMERIIGVACHEITHWYQYQAAGHQKAGRRKWITEGVADVIKLHIVESYQGGEFNKYRQNCLKSLKKAAKIPSLKELDSRKDWEAARDRYGSGVVYAKADLAVMELAQRLGTNSLFYYFLYLKHYPPAQAFNMAFKMDLQKFESEMDQKFHK